MKFQSCPLISGMYLNINGCVDSNEPILTLCCENIPDKPGVAFKETAEESLENFIGMRSLVVAESIKNASTNQITSKFIKGCTQCSKYVDSDQEVSLFISYVNLSMYPAPCQCRCCYCEVEKQWKNTPEVQQGYEKLFKMLELAKESGMILANAVWQVSTGEITIHPYRKRIMELVRGQRSIFYTNAFRFDEDIAQNLHDNLGSAINVSIDAGTPATWNKVKGVNNFEEVTSNLVRYYKASGRPGQITLKYIILPDINDNYEDFASVMEIMKILEVKHLTVSRDMRYKYEYTDEYQMKLLGGSAYLLAMCHKNNFTVDMFTYTSEEQKEVIQLAQEILRTNQI